MRDDMPTTVLIIEDNDQIRESTAEILELSDYRVYTAEHGKAGVELAMKHLPDIILCDIMMPELDGYGVLYLLSKNKKTKYIPFIFLTARVERADLRKAMELGADDYLTKPFDDLELLNAIEVRLKKRRELNGDRDGFDSHMEQDDERLLHLLVKESRVRKLRKKQNIYLEGDSPHFLFFVLDGRVREYLYHNDGRELVTTIYSRGDYFGYDSLLLQQSYNHSTETLEDTDIAQVSKDDFFELLYRKPSIANKFLKLLSGDKIYKEQQLLAFAYDSVRKKVANALLNIGLNSVRSSGDDECVVRISRDNLSALAGTANETISRMLTDFIEEGVIEKEGNAIRIKSLKALGAVKQ